MHAFTQAINKTFLRKILLKLQYFKRFIFSIDISCNTSFTQIIKETKATSEKLNFYDELI